MKREGNLDLLRVFCCIAVIVEHVCGYFINDVKKLHIGGVCILATSSYFAVPCFLMLTGAFAYKRIDNPSEFYKRNFVKLGMPTIIFSMLYSVWYVLLAFKDGNGIAGMFTVAELWKTGWRGHPLWYMYMCIGLYALIPIVQKAVMETNVNICVTSLLFCVWACISWYSAKFDLTWNLGRVALSFSYIIIGYAIKNTFTSKDNKKGVIFIVCGFLFLIVNGFLVYRCLLLDSNWRNWANDFSVFVMLGSILIFAGFCKIDYTNEVKIAKHTFMIYLFHKGVLEITQFITGKFLVTNRSIFMILIVIIIEVFVVFVVSFEFSVVYSKLQKFISKSSIFRG